MTRRALRARTLAHQPSDGSRRARFAHEHGRRWSRSSRSPTATSACAGTPEEGAPANDPGVLLNGFHETWPIVYPEDAYGLARTGQTIVNAPDGSIIRLFVDDEPFDLATAADPALRAGARHADRRAAARGRVGDRARPAHAHPLAPAGVAASTATWPPCDYEVVALDGPCGSRSPPSSSPTARRGAPTTRGAARASPRRCSCRRAPRRRARGRCWRSRTRNSGLELACGMEHAIDARAPATVEVARRRRRRRRRRAGRARRRRAAAAVEVRRLPLGARRARRRPRRPRATARSTARRATASTDRGPTSAATWRTFWERSDVQLDGAPDLQRAVRFNLFQLMQATARSEGLGVPAKGLTGRGYEGHYFWDTEIYVVPFLIHTTPGWAKHVLRFRCGMLDAARRTRARGRPRRGAVPVAHDQRRGGLRVVRRGHRAVPHQRRHRLRPAPVQRRHRRPRASCSTTARRGARRDGAAVDGARLLLRAPRRALLHQRRHRARRVHDGRRQQRLHEPHGQGEPRGRRARRRVAAPAQDPTAHAALVARHAADRGRGRRLAPRRRAACTSRATRSRASCCRTSTSSSASAGTSTARRPTSYPLLLHYHPLELYRHQVIKQTDVVLATYLVGPPLHATTRRGGRSTTTTR